MSDPRIISFQGELGAYSHQACRETYPHLEPLPCPSFEDAIDAVNSGKADLAMLPVENSTYGRVADIHRLLPGAGLSIIGEHFLRVRIALLATQGAKLNEIKQAMSHTVLLGQCRNFLAEHKISPVVAADTAGAAKAVAAGDNPIVAALASSLAGETYGLDILADDIEDNDHNTTRFLIMAREPITIPDEAKTMTSFVFRVRNIPAALYKAMGGFATNGVNMVKLESYMIGGSFMATQFYADIEGHPEDPAVKRAMEELTYFTTELTILGTYKAAAARPS